MEETNQSRPSALRTEATDTPQHQHESTEKPLAKPQDDRIPIEESIEARIERLGRQRPEIFPSLIAEIGFVFSVCMSQIFGVRPRYFLTLNIPSMLTRSKGVLCVGIHRHPANAG